MNTNTFALCTWFLIGGMLTACGSGSETTSALNTQETADADSPSSNDTADNSTVETATESDSSGAINDGETAESTTQDSDQNSGEGSTETNPANPQNDGQNDSDNDSENAGEQAGTTSQPAPKPDAEDSSSEPVIVNNQRVTFGSAKLLADVEPNGDSHPGNFHRAGDKLYFWTVDADPRLANCAPHWSRFSDADKSIAFNLVAADPATGAVTMNKQIMTLGDFADNPNDTCVGFNGSFMQAYNVHWNTQQSVTDEQQFVVQFRNDGLDQAWKTDGTETNTSLTGTGQIFERSIFDGDKVFFATHDGLSVADTFTGPRRKLFESSRQWDIGQIQKSPSRQATFEIGVESNRTQIWTYDHDTDVWEKKFSLKPDSSSYRHHSTLLVDGEILLTWGINSSTRGNPTGLAFSNNYGDVKSFEFVTNLPPRFSNPGFRNIRLNTDEINNDELTFSTTDFSVQPNVTSAWRYRDGRTEKLFSISEPDLNDTRLIAGQDGRIYIVATREIQPYPEFTANLELWSYDPQTEQLIEVSSDDWYAVKHKILSRDEGYTFRYVNTPHGLAFLNLKDDSGRELWFTDGTRAGTRQITDINPGTGNSDPDDFYYGGDAIYFSADDGIHGREPWMVPISR